MENNRGICFHLFSIGGLSWRRSSTISQHCSNSNAASQTVPELFAVHCDCIYIMYMYVSSSYSPGDEFRATLPRTHREEPQIIVLACFHICTALERGLRQTIELSGPRMCELAEQNIEYDFNGLWELCSWLVTWLHCVSSWDGGIPTLCSSPPCRSRSSH